MQIRVELGIDAQQAQVAEQVSVLATDTFQRVPDRKTRLISEAVCTFRATLHDSRRRWGAIYGNSHD